MAALCNTYDVVITRMQYVIIPSVHRCRTGGTVERYRYMFEIMTNWTPLLIYHVYYCITACVFVLYMFGFWKY